MLLHQLREHLVLARELGFERGDLLLERRRVWARRGGEGSRAVLEKLLLPAGELRGLETVLVARLGGGRMVDEMASKDGDLLIRCIAASLFSWHFVLQKVEDDARAPRSPVSAEAIHSL